MSLNKRTEHSFNHEQVMPTDRKYIYEKAVRLHEPLQYAHFVVHSILRKPRRDKRPASRNVVKQYAAFSVFADYGSARNFMRAPQFRRIIHQRRFAVSINFIQGFSILYVRLDHLNLFSGFPDRREFGCFSHPQKPVIFPIKG